MARGQPLAALAFLLAATRAAADVNCAADVFECPGGAFVNRDPNNNCEFYPCPPVICAADTFQCPGGAFVNRDPNNNCEFYPCPPVICAADTFECPGGVFVSRDPNNNCEFYQCPPVICPADVFECPGGVFVSRDPNNKCEFEECPSPEYDCKTRDVWSAERQEWCCENEGLGCTCPTCSKAPEDAECVACLQDMSKEEFCLRFPLFTGCDGCGRCSVGKFRKGRGSLKCLGCLAGLTKSELCEYALQKQPRSWSPDFNAVTRAVVESWEEDNKRQGFLRIRNTRFCKKSKMPRRELAVTVSAGGEDSDAGVRVSASDDKAPVYNCDMSLLSIGSVATNVLLALVIITLAVIVCRDRTSPRATCADVELEQKNKRRKRMNYKLSYANRPSTG